MLVEELPSTLGLQSNVTKHVSRAYRQPCAPPLTLDDRLTKIARAHSEEMAKKRTVFHHSPTTGTPEDRVRRAHIKNSMLAENLAQASSEEEAERSLLDSPGHRRNILDPTLTQIGIGVAAIVSPQGNRVLYITQLFLTE